MDTIPKCPDCDAPIGEPHTIECDVARCLWTGRQRISCEEYDSHDCGHDQWSGAWPGDADCERLGLMIGPNLPDLNRLYTECEWDSEKQEWVKPT